MTTRFVIHLDVDLDSPDNTYSTDETYRNLQEALEAGTVPAGVSAHVEFASGDVTTGLVRLVEINGKEVVR